MHQCYGPLSPSFYILNFTLTFLPSETFIFLPHSTLFSPHSLTSSSIGTQELRIIRPEHLPRERRRLKTRYSHVERYEWFKLSLTVHSKDREWEKRKDDHIYVSERRGCTLHSIRNVLDVSEGCCKFSLSFWLSHFHRENQESIHQNVPLPLSPHLLWMS